MSVYAYISNMGLVTFFKIDKLCIISSFSLIIENN